jgi:hypothetical protein
LYIDALGISSLTMFPHFIGDMYSPKNRFAAEKGLRHLPVTPTVAVPLFWLLPSCVAKLLSHYFSAGYAPIAPKGDFCSTLINASIPPKFKNKSLSLKRTRHTQ